MSMSKPFLQLNNQIGRDHQSIADVVISNRDFWISAISIISISLVLAMRVLYTAPDDLAYVEWFYWAGDISAEGWWDYLLEEPIWRAYALLMASIADPELSLRVTIFLGSLTFLAASSKLARGAFFFIVLIFILDVTLSTQIYYNQVRQGFALSIFLMAVAGGLSPVLGAAIAGTVHSSLFILVPCAIAAYFPQKIRAYLIGTIVAVLVSIFLLRDMGGSWDLGRRSDTYAFENVLSVNFYLAFVLQFGIVLLCMSQEDLDERQRYWLRMSYIFVVVTLCLCLIHEAMARLTCIANTLIVILLGRNLGRESSGSLREHAAAPSSLFSQGLKRERAWFYVMFWLLMTVAYQINEGIKLQFNDDSWYGRWMLILGLVH